MQQLMREMNILIEVIDAGRGREEELSVGVAMAERKLLEVGSGRIHVGIC
jgi:hypothetical protein